MIVRQRSATSRKPLVGRKVKIRRKGAFVKQLGIQIDKTREAFEASLSLAALGDLFHLAVDEGVSDAQGASFAGVQLKVLNSGQQLTEAQPEMILEDFLLGSKHSVKFEEEMERRRNGVEEGLLGDLGLVILNRLLLFFDAGWQLVQREESLVAVKLFFTPQERRHPQSKVEREDVGSYFGRQLGKVLEQIVDNSFEVVLGGETHRCSGFLAIWFKREARGNQFGNAGEALGVLPAEGVSYHERAQHLFHDLANTPRGVDANLEKHL